jgi:Cu/Ag efflux pump CusA
MHAAGPRFRAGQNSSIRIVGIGWQFIPHIGGQTMLARGVTVPDSGHMSCTQVSQRHRRRIRSFPVPRRSCLRPC